VIDFKLTSDDWAGPFGFVLLRLHEARHDGEAAYFIQTDASDEAFAKERELVYVPKIAPMATEDMSGEIFLIDDQPAVVSSIPGRRLHAGVARAPRELEGRSARARLRRRGARGRQGRRPDHPGHGDRARRTCARARPARPPPATSARSPAGRACRTAGPRSYSSRRPAGRCIVSVTPR